MIKQEKCGRQKNYKNTKKQTINKEPKMNNIISGTFVHLVKLIPVSDKQLVYRKPCPEDQNFEKMLKYCDLPTLKAPLVLLCSVVWRSLHQYCQYPGSWSGTEGPWPWLAGWGVPAGCTSKVKRKDVEQHQQKCDEELPV